MCRTIWKFSRSTLRKNGVYQFSGGGRHPFSNFYNAGCTFEDMEYPNGEAAFQAAKTLDMRERKKFQTVNPGQAKRMGRQLNLRLDWEQIKYQVMVDVLLSKFQDLQLRQMLIETGDQQIIEDTTGWHDNEWGRCSCPKCQGKRSKNLLGKALMEVRDKLSNQI